MKKICFFAICVFSLVNLTHCSAQTTDKNQETQIYQLEYSQQKIFERYGTDSSSFVINYRYDGISWLVLSFYCQINDGAGLRTYTYDPVGNLIQSVELSFFYEKGTMFFSLSNKDDPKPFLDAIEFACKKLEEEH